MRKKIQKLTLSKETLRDLETGQLKEVEGGAATRIFSCFDSCQRTCTC
jgi:hypothetical protein